MFYHFGSSFLTHTSTADFLVWNGQWPVGVNQGRTSDQVNSLASPTRVFLLTPQAVLVIMSAAVLQGAVTQLSRPSWFSGQAVVSRSGVRAPDCTALNLGFPLAQLVKNPPAMPDTWVVVPSYNRRLGWVLSFERQTPDVLITDIPLGLKCIKLRVERFILSSHLLSSCSSKGMTLSDK